MSDSNRIQLALIKEATLGMTPASPRFRVARLTGESLAFAPVFISSDEIRTDRMNADPIEVNVQNQGAINAEISYPVDLSPLSELYQSGLFGTWTVTPTRDNDGTADSIITNVATSGTIVTCLTGAAFVASQLVRFTGFGVAGNNGVFKCTTGSATVPAFVGSGITDEAAPAAAARMKVVGFQGAASDITATSTGLGSSALDFTTLGLAVGQWIKVGGTAAGVRFATAALNDWIRITAVTATALTCDNLPTGWATDAGTGKTLNVYFGDKIKNGTTRESVSIERGFLDQTVPTYILQKGMVVDKLTHSFVTEQKITGSFELKGLSGAQSTATAASTLTAATTNSVMSANVSVGRIAEAGAVVVSPNFIKSLTFDLANNLRLITAVGTVGAVDIGVGESALTGTMETYFGSNALLQKLIAGTPSSINVRAAINSQAVVWQFPRVTFTAGSPSAGAKNQDVLLPLQFMGSIDSTTNAQILIDRLEYFEV